MPSKYVIGSGALLEWAMAAWTEAAPEETLHPLDVVQDGNYTFDLSALNGISPADATAFVAWGPQFLNFRRLELMGEFKTRGFKLPPLICRTAVVAPGVSIGENCAIGAAAVISHGCKIGFNSHIGDGVVVGSGAQVGSSTWIADGVQIGSTARIGNNATLGLGVLISEGLTIGRQCILDRPGMQLKPLADKTFVTTAFPTGVFVIDNGI
ncbi:DapH/DapD/GlmU-related protein [Acidovorax sp. A1169]|uniref:DapH/DapD/GlmU-related protein n=1 Tax=Acidovorax sp. A1169 TaxID=3059524 RepID=UPI002737895E|nr:DapH/DapD/GlmU-related protein [Acidovorax sp. A1169]MDP4075698.1 DapH/DapD/GlmU-related protein [Acidovorax sp. A1169]